MKLSVKQFIRKNIRNYFIIVAVFMAIVLNNSENLFPELINFICGPIELDYDKAFTNNNLIDIKSDQTHNGSGDTQIIVEGGYREKVNLDTQRILDFENCYKQGIRYKFTVKPEQMHDIGLNNEITYYLNEIKASDSMVTYKLILLDTGKGLIFARVKPDYDITPGQTYTGIFVPFNIQLYYEMRSMVGTSTPMNNVFGYELDTFMEGNSVERSDIIFSSIMIITALGMLFILILFIKNYKNHPAYKQFSKLYGNTEENVAELDEELQNISKVTVVKKTYTTEHWIIKKGVFKTKFSMADKKSRFDT